MQDQSVAHSNAKHLGTKITELNFPRPTHLPPPQSAQNEAGVMLPAGVSHWGTVLSSGRGQTGTTYDTQTPLRTAHARAQKARVDASFT